MKAAKAKAKTVKTAAKKTTLAVYNRRLLKLADFLEKLPRQRFSFHSWVGPEWGGAQDLSCGTTACALGWACTIPAFQRLGARIEQGEDCVYPDLAWKNRVDTYEVSRGLFGLTFTEHCRLFLPGWARLGENPTPKQVAKRLRDFVSTRKACVGMGKVR
jgi:hypothetical protein